PKVVDRLAEALDGLHRVLGGVDLGALAAAPQDEDLAAQLSREVDGLHRLADRVAADLRHVAGERAILEDGVEEEGDRAHDELKARLLQRRSEERRVGKE